MTFAFPKEQVITFIASARAVVVDLTQGISLGYRRFQRGRSRSANAVLEFSVGTGTDSLRRDYPAEARAVWVRESHAEEDRWTLSKWSDW